MLYCAACKSRGVALALLGRQQEAAAAFDVGIVEVAPGGRGSVGGAEAAVLGAALRQGRTVAHGRALAESREAALAAAAEAVRAAASMLPTDGAGGGPAPEDVLAAAAAADVPFARSGGRPAHAAGDGSPSSSLARVLVSHQDSIAPLQAQADAAARRRAQDAKVARHGARVRERLHREEQARAAAESRRVQEETVRKRAEARTAEAAADAKFVREENDRSKRDGDMRIKRAAHEWTKARAGAEQARALEQAEQQRRKLKADEAAAKWNPDHAAALRQAAKDAVAEKQRAKGEALVKKQEGATASRARQYRELNDKLSAQREELEAATKHHVQQRARKAEADAEHFALIAKQDDEEHTARIEQIKIARGLEQAERNVKAEAAMARARDRAEQVVEEAEAATAAAGAKAAAAEVKALALAARRKSENAARARERQRKEHQKVLAAEQRKREHEAEQERQRAALVAGGRSGSEGEAAVAEQRRKMAERGRTADERRQREEREAEELQAAVQARQQAAKQAAYDAQALHRQQQPPPRPQSVGGMFVAQRLTALTHDAAAVAPAAVVVPSLVVPEEPAGAQSLARLVQEHAEAANFFGSAPHAGAAVGPPPAIEARTTAALSFSQQLPETVCVVSPRQASRRRQGARAAKVRASPAAAAVQPPDGPTPEQLEQREEARLASLVQQAKSAKLDVTAVSAVDLIKLLQRDPALLSSGLLL